MKELSEKLRDPFYRHYLWYTALETELLFYMVCDVTFLTQVKQITMEQVSRITFVSLVISLLIQYPLLKFINREGSRTAVRLGSLAFLLSSVLITFAPGYFTILAGGILKCIGHTLNTMGTAIMKNHLKEKRHEDQFVSFQSDANSAASLLMMITSFLSGVLYRINAYYPMFACIALCFAGIIASFLISRREQSSDEIHPASSLKKYAEGNRTMRKTLGASVFVSFAMFTALTGTGLSYSRLNVQELLSGMGSDYVVSTLGTVSALVYLSRFLSNVMMGNTWKTLRNKAFAGASILLVIGLFLETLPWAVPFMHTWFLLCAGYLLQAFVRDPYVTLIQNISLDDDPHRQQTLLVSLNGAKKGGTILLTLAGTLILRTGSIRYVMIMMTVVACLNLLFSLHLIKEHRIEQEERDEDPMGRTP